MLQAITRLVMDPLSVKNVLKALFLWQDLAAALNAQQASILMNLEVLNAPTVKLGASHQEMDQQAVNCVL